MVSFVAHIMKLQGLTPGAHAGVELILYFKTIRVLFGTTGGVRKKFKVFYAIFSSIMAFLITVWVITTAVFCQKVWLQDSNYPGGPDAYFGANISDWYLDWGTTAVIILQLMTDGLMVGRARRCQNLCSIWLVSDPSLSDHMQ